jgi:hypothetical protein
MIHGPLASVEIRRYLHKQCCFFRQQPMDLIFKKRNGVRAAFPSCLCLCRLIFCLLSVTVTLNVEQFHPVNWNKKAFDRLVLDAKTKELITALIDVQMSNNKKMDDIITGKGNGLIILLHGSPGTGKTLTAERSVFHLHRVLHISNRRSLSVAEIAEKPLYRVTCGDIGTDADDVEKYLETVLYLGKTWNCGKFLIASRN